MATEMDGDTSMIVSTCLNGENSKMHYGKHGGQRPPACIIKSFGWRVIVMRNVWGEYVSDEWSGRRKDNIFSDGTTPTQALAPGE